MFCLEEENKNKMKNSIVYNYILENLIGGIDKKKNKQLIEKQKINITDNLVKKKYGSLQRFIKNTEVSANYGSDVYRVDEIHKIGVLDLRILNCDRNDENILVLKYYLILYI
jgi:hypothetical protein